MIDIAKYENFSTFELLSEMINHTFQNKIALVSSFGAESAVLLHIISTIKKDLPIIFLNTEKLFGETLRYKDQLIALLGLSDVRSIRPDPEKVERLDSDGILWYGNPDVCCTIRKVEPLEKALKNFDAWITGRKQFQSDLRKELPLIEYTDNGKIKINPLATWKKGQLNEYFKEYNLPRHPLEAEGFLSIGCMPCTDRVKPGEDARSGRWKGCDKTECGIHLPITGKWKINDIG